MTEANPVQKTEKNDSVAEIRARRKQECALGYRLFAAHRWGDLGDGHISARDPEKTDCFWMLRWGVSYHAARVSDLVLVGPDGSLVEGEGTSISRDTIFTIRFWKHDRIWSARCMSILAGDRRFLPRQE